MRETTITHNDLIRPISMLDKSITEKRLLSVDHKDNKVCSFLYFQDMFSLTAGNSKKEIK